MNEISPENARYIKLGTGGKFEYTCIKENNTIRLDYRDVPHDLCLSGDWDAVYDWIVKEKGSEPRAATNHCNQIRYFYKDGPNILWVTFYKNQLWWCFAHPEVHLLPDGTKVRHLSKGWHNRDVKGSVLEMVYLNGELTSMQGFRGTICRVRLWPYLVRKINGKLSSVEKEAMEARHALTETLVAVIQSLSWQDFELLIDLVSQRAGWQRISAVGEKQKTLDIDLFSPITNERYLVQIKSRAGQGEFRAFHEETRGMEAYSKCFFVSHSPKAKLSHSDQTETHRLWLHEDVARLVIQYGLIDWVIAKAK